MCVFKCVTVCVLKEKEKIDVLRYLLLRDMIIYIYMYVFNGYECVCVICMDFICI